MKLRTRGLKAAAAVIAVGALIGAGMTPAQAAPRQIIVWADETRGPQLKALIDGNTTIAPGYVVKVRFFASLTALQSAWDKATAAGVPDVITGPASFISGAKTYSTANAKSFKAGTFLQWPDIWCSARR